MLLTMILAIFWLIIVPLFSGLGILKFSKKDNKSICFSYVLGILIEFLVYEMFAIPYTFLKLSFNCLKLTWLIIMLCIFVFSIIINRKRFKEIALYTIGEIKKLPKIMTILFIIVLCLQCYVSFAYMHEDYDDSNFVAKASIGKDTNTLFVYDDIGNTYTKFPTRHVFSPFPYFTGTIASLSFVHPTILAHTILPVIFIFVAYSVYYLLGKSLFKGDYDKTITFLFILTIIYSFGNYTRYSPFVRLLYRAWQGKSMLANLILPFIWYLYLEYLGEENDLFYWIVLAITMWSAILLSSMSLFLPVISVGIITILYSIKDKNYKYLLKTALCCIPNFIYGLIYLIIK